MVNGPGRLAAGPLVPRVSRPGWRGVRRLILAGFALAAALGSLYGLRRPILWAYAQQFRVVNAAPSDLIVMLLGSPNHRPRRAAELHHVLALSSGLSLRELDQV